MNCITFDGLRMSVSVYFDLYSLLDQGSRSLVLCAEYGHRLLGEVIESSSCVLFYLCRPLFYLLKTC